MNSDKNEISAEKESGRIYTSDTAVLLLNWQLKRDEDCVISMVLLCYLNCVISMVLLLPKCHSQVIRAKPRSIFSFVVDSIPRQISFDILVFSWSILVFSQFDIKHVSRYLNQCHLNCVMLTNSNLQSEKFISQNQRNICFRLREIHID